ncbi:YopX family protein [Mammaliicoccus sciuri]|uniref:YopX family protein n=1 Tax=Mammaliicoccus sciuri TaxID=1296 RepID=UPI003CF009A7
MLPRYKAIDNETGVMLRVLSIDLEFDYIIGLPFEEEARDTFGELIIEKRYYFEDIELLQSTGLFDKNGKEIFEGDIVKHDPVPNQFISNAYFEIIQARSGEWRMDNYRGGQVLAYSNHEVEVVGNKFEQPHLLGED